jgi:methionine sulfoxide reductase heme-binding subunit
MPWRDPSGRVSPLKLIVFVSLFLPALWTAYAFWHGNFGAARPVNEAIHEIGRWTIRLIFLALAITPLRWSLDWPRLLLVRRMVGVAAFAYVLLHLSLYTVDQAFDLWKVASEIVLRIYLELGFTALLILAALAITSTDATTRRLGRNWQRLHNLVYVAAAIAVVHQFMQSKADVDEPWVMAGLYVWLMGYRGISAAFKLRNRVPGWALGLLSIASGLLTALGESVYYWIKVGVSPMRVLAADLALNAWRPGWVVLAIGTAVTAAAALRALSGGKRRRGGHLAATMVAKSAAVPLDP